MRDYFLELIKHYHELEKRERVAVLSLSIFLVGVVLYLGIWAPVNNYALEAQIDHDRYLKLLTYLKSTESQARRSRKSRVPERPLANPCLVRYQNLLEASGSKRADFSLRAVTL